MSSPQSPLSLLKKPTTITDLPPELITSIYKHLDKPSSIAALSSTCRKNYLVWQSDAASISSAVIYDNISSFSTALELLYIQEKTRDVDFTTNPPSTGHLLEIQQEARNAVLRDKKGGYWGASLSGGDHDTIMVRNKTLISNAEKANHEAALWKWGVEVSPDGSVHTRSSLKDGDGCLSWKQVTSAFYRIWILTTLGLGEAMEERLGSVEKETLDDVANVMIHLAYYCADNDKIFLGVSRGLGPGCSERRLCTEWDLGCQYDANWLMAFLKISEASEWDCCVPIVIDLQRTLGGCQGNCSTSGKTEIKEEEWSLKLKNGCRGE